ncbi:YciI family protein [Streptomyces sp. NPDC001070]
MTRYLLAVTYGSGAGTPPMTEWKPEEITAHLDYCAALHRELVSSGELVESRILTGPELATIVTSDGVSAPVRTDGPFAEVGEWVAGYRIVDVESQERAIEIAARASAVPGAGGVPTRQPVHVRRVMDDVPGDVAGMESCLRSGE